MKRDPISRRPREKNEGLLLLIRSLDFTNTMGEGFVERGSNYIAAQAIRQLTPLLRRDYDPNSHTYIRNFDAHTQ